jgi:hypothetical protein
MKIEYRFKDLSSEAKQEKENLNRKLENRKQQTHDDFELKNKDEIMKKVANVVTDEMATLKLKA